MITEARLFQRLPDGTVLCGTCQRGCRIPPGKAGWCGTRVNQDGTLQSLIYGEVSSLSMNPIEKKPVFHFFPGSRWLSVGSLGCNFRCPGCQNWEISHWIHGKMRTAFLSPEELVRRTRAAGCLGVSWTFNEPALWFEYTLDGAKKAKEEGLFTNYVTNGSIAREALAAIAPYLDVYRVDLKGFSDRTYARMGHVGEWRGILDVARQAKAHGIHVEVVTNVIPRINDSDTELKGIAAWIRDALGPETPWHVTRFFPHRDWSDLPPTEVSRLESARELGKEAGLWYVYLGNVPDHPWENTFCHACAALLIERHIFDVRQNRMVAGRCPECGERVPGRF
ncbi:MAG: AmmeMemoRadiSam system radical SAM enzyme [Gemmatimonadetes bacterium]|nr:AmmeMemoRadiSam system radical SAM enzyme [Gemmatimonadota bacterium]